MPLASMVLRMAATGLSVAAAPPGITIYSGAYTTGTYTDTAGQAWSYYSFTSSANVDVVNMINVNRLIVAGGGGGRYEWVAPGPGGGGMLVDQGITIPDGNYTLVIGAGGTGVGSGQVSNNGSDSSAFGATAIGGGSYSTRNGGSGAGGIRGGNTEGLGVAGQGYDGAPYGPSYGGYSLPCAGGGGGAGGTPATPGASQPSAPGPGLANDFTGAAVTYAAGGRGAQTLLYSGYHGAVNTGNAAQYGYGNNNGGSGVIVLRWRV